MQTTEAKLKNRFEEYTEVFDGIDAVAEKKYYYNFSKELRHGVMGQSSAQFHQKQKDLMDIAIGAPNAEGLREKYKMTSKL